MNRNSYKMQCMCLAVIDGAGGVYARMTNAVLAKTIGRSPSQVATYMNHLQAMGMVVRDDDKTWAINNIGGGELAYEIDRRIAQGKGELQTLQHTLHVQSKFLAMALAS